MFKKAFILVLVMVASVCAQITDDTFTDSGMNHTTEMLNNLVGIWEGSYRAGQGETGLTLTVFEEGGNFKAIFDFYNLPGKNNAASGKYYMNVSYDASTERYSLVGYEWIKRPSSYGFADLEGTLTGNVFSGSTYDFKTIRIDEAAIAEREAEVQRQNEEVAEGFYSNLASALNPSLAKEMKKLFAEVSTNITNENTKTDARNDIAWRKQWIKRLTDTENMFYKIFSNRGKPYTLFYSTGIKQGSINYQTETITLSTFLNLRMNDNWIGILDIAFQMVKAMDDKLQDTGRRGQWGLKDWPNTGMTKTNPFSNTFYGGGMSGTTRNGTQWKTDFSIVVELLNDKNRVIGKQSIDISHFFEIYCNNRNFYGRFVEYGEHGGTVVDANRAIRLKNEINNIKTIIFNNVKVNDISDTMTIRIASINKNSPKNAGIQIIPLSESEWSENDWNEKPKPKFYFR